MPLDCLLLMSTIDILPTLQERSAKLERIANSLFEHGFAVWDDFIPKEISKMLRDNALTLFRNDEMKKAGIGTSFLHQVDKEVRGDYIHWIDNDSTNNFEQHYLTFVNQLISFFNQSCYLGIRDYEIHYAFYPVGTHYEKHLDQLSINGKRSISIVCYLNENWKKGDGGELRIFHKNDDGFTDFAPLEGRLALFISSEIYHEVLHTEKERVALTGWLLNQPKALTFT